jgi:hypothetical protein
VDASQPWIARRIDHLGLADGGQQALMWTRIHQRIFFAALEILLDRHHRLATGFKSLGVTVEQIARHHCSRFRPHAGSRGTSEARFSGYAREP